MRNVLLPLSAFLLACACLWEAGFRVNVTASMPAGIYRVASGTPERGDYVSFCPEKEAAELALERGYLQPGYCPSGAHPLLKRLVGLEGDAVRVASEGIYVNGALQPMSGVLPEDKNGLPLRGAELGERVPPGRALLLADHRGSYDSRYFGFVPSEGLQRVRAVSIWRQ
ncbi:MAG: conjugative transfer signal peptidase TraF [Desulfovibrio sp.]|jgi:conjugative transfer signal peptidase TraF|nr:conjugative transfer signal peptidase TraF [Desulfovibrio sp.]